MDVLLSLPILSFFAGPALTSWSTSLNLLFFYMTWTTLVLSHSPLRIELVGTFAIRAVLWFVPSVLFLLLDTLLPSVLENVKINGARSLPRRDPVPLLKQVLLAVVNLALFTALQAGISIGTTTLLRAPLFKTSTTLPLPWQIIKNIALLYTSREVLTYYIHRYALHSTGVLTRLHKAFAHSHVGAPYSLMLYADHPVALFLHRLLPIYLPSLLIRPHLLTYFLFTALTTLEEMLSMSGYTVVPGIIMGGITWRTAYHYVSGGRGNYGAWGLLDWIHGTSVGKDVISDIQDEAEKHHLKERGENAASQGADIVQAGVEGFKKGKRSSNRKKA